MDKLEAMAWTAKLANSIAKLPDDVEIHGFDSRINLDSKPHFSNVISIHLSKPIDCPAVFIGNRYSGWHEKRTYLDRDVYAWWSEQEEGNE